MRYTSSLLALLLAFLPALASSPVKSRRTYRLLQVRQHLAVPSAISCTDVDGDSTPDPELKDGDICVDSDDETFCFYAGGEMRCISGASSASQLRQKILLHDDFLQVDAIDNSDMGTAQVVESARFRWRWVPSGTLSNQARLGPASVSTSNNVGHSGVLRIAYGDNDSGGIRSPDPSEGRPYQIILGNYDTVTLHVLLRLYTSYSGGIKDIQGQVGFCESFSGGNCHGDSAVIEFSSTSGQFKDDAYGHVYCWKSSSEKKREQFSPAWRVDQEWHRWTVKWTASDSMVRFYKDGVEVGSCTTDYFEPTAILNVVPFTAETGGNDPANQTVYIDYVQLVAEPASSVQR